MATFEHDPDDFVEPIRFGRFLTGFSVALLLVYACAFLGYYLGS
jgi:hypothetical protein